MFKIIFKQSNYIIKINNVNEVGNKLFIFIESFIK